MIAGPYSYLQLKEQDLEAVPSLNELRRAERFDGAVTIEVVDLTLPWEQLQTSRSMLREGRMFYLSASDGSVLNVCINSENWMEVQNPSHLLRFTPLSMERLSRKSGFDHIRCFQWRVNFSKNNLVQAKDRLQKSFWLDGVLLYPVFV